MLAGWAWVAGAYGAILAVAALAAPHPPGHRLAAGCLAYGLAGLGLGSFSEVAAVQLVAPGLLLLAGYWLSGPFFRDPQPWLERWLVASDRAVFSALALQATIARIPGVVLALLEASYAAVHGVVAAGALFMATHGAAAVEHYWNLVLPAGLACYVTLPWLRSRPPRALEPPGRLAARRSALRRMNIAILDRASVQATTIPSGHVAAPVAAALAAFAVSETAGWILLGFGFVVAVAATLGRYHYAVDCLAGALAAALIAWIAAA